MVDKGPLQYALSPDSFIFIGIYFCMNKVFLNSLLATLNARASLREAGAVQSFPLRGVRGDTSAQSDLSRGPETVRMSRRLFELIFLTSVSSPLPSAWKQPHTRRWIHLVTTTTCVTQSPHERYKHLIISCASETMEFGTTVGVQPRYEGLIRAGSRSASLILCVSYFVLVRPVRDRLLFYRMRSLTGAPGVGPHYPRTSA